MYLAVPLLNDAKTSNPFSSPTSTITARISFCVDLCPLASCLLYARILILGSEFLSSITFSYLIQRKECQTDIVEVVACFLYISRDCHKITSCKLDLSHCLYKGQSKFFVLLVYF